MTDLDLPAHADVRLIAADMDGTLLDGHGEVPAGLWPLLDELHSRDVLFAPASGRQYATLRRMFDTHADGMVFIAENGTYVVRDGQELSSNVLDPAVVAAIVESMRQRTDLDVGVVVCGKRSAYIERPDPVFRAEADKYYAKLALIDDVLAAEDDVLKVAVYDFGSSETGEGPALAAFAATHQVVVSGQHWVDVMNAGVDKGTALRGLQRALGVTADQTVAFGDYLNDLELLEAAGLSFAMANAHPRIKQVARYLAPANTDGGVTQVVRALLRS